MVGNLTIIYPLLGNEKNPLYQGQIIIQNLLILKKIKIKTQIYEFRSISNKRNY
jgi:hypothetical protein